MEADSHSTSSGEGSNADSGRGPSEEGENNIPGEYSLHLTENSGSNSTFHSNGAKLQSKVIPSEFLLDQPIFGLSGQINTWGLECDFEKTSIYPGIWIIHVRINGDPPVRDIHSLNKCGFRFGSLGIFCTFLLVSNYPLDFKFHSKVIKLPTQSLRAFSDTILCHNCSCSDNGETQHQVVRLYFV